MSYKPPFDLNEEILSLTAEVSERVENMSASIGLDKSPKLRRENRIKTIQGTLAIESNTLSVEQVTAVIDGKRVLAPPKDIEEVKNAFEIYELLDTLNPYSVTDLLKAHGVLMRGLIQDSGAFRTKSVGVVDSKSGEILHFGTLPNYVESATVELLEWTENSNLHPLIKSSVFHYEFEVIHPFLDGNGRLGRLWHTLILSKWNYIFAYLPIESMIFENQTAYYKCINECNIKTDSTDFIIFMLNIIMQALDEI